MNGEINFSISTEELTEKGREIEKNSKIIRDALESINEARTSLEGWVSTNKDKYDSRIARALPKMQEMIDAIESFGRVAVETSNRAMETEQKIASAIDKIQA